MVDTRAIEVRKRSYYTKLSKLNGTNFVRYEDVLTVFEAMKEDSVQPDEVAYLCVLRALVDSGAPEQVPRVYEELLKARISPGAKVELVRTEAYFKMVRTGRGSRKVWFSYEGERL